MIIRLKKTGRRQNCNNRSVERGKGEFLGVLHYLICWNTLGITALRCHHKFDFPVFKQSFFPCMLLAMNLLLQKGRRVLRKRT